MWQTLAESVADLDVADRPVAGPDAFEEVGHVVVVRPRGRAGVVEPGGVVGQRLVDELLVAGLDPAPADEDPALVADEAVAVLALGGGDQPGPVGVLIGDGEVVVAVVVVDEVLGQLRADGRGGDRAGVVLAEAPLGDVVVVRAPVGQLAAGVLVPPAELVVAPLLDVGDVGRRALPEVPVEPLRGPRIP